MNERQERFIDLLRQIFELDKADLDFGIYRILNIRRHEIDEFFTTRLPQKIIETLQPFATGNKDNIRQRMKEIEQMFAGMDIESLPETNSNVAEYKQLKQQLQQGTDLSALESDVYSALYSFFSRYYDEGDFISKRRYKEGVYAIPYEGEEVKLYWANQDQYYIKTSENFKDYTFVADDYTIHFRLVDATTEQNNNKETQDKKRKFMLFVEDEVQYPGIKTFSVEDNEVSIRFLYDVPKDPKVKYDETNLAAINDWINAQPDVQLRMALLRIVNPEAKADKRKTVVKKHIDAYVAKNSFDYFIHKDLGGFLTRELDFFIKNEVMHLDDLDTASEARVGSYLAKVRAIKRVGKDIITFLAQLENFQKRLWLKKKFVVETNWCITLDRIPAKYYDEIRKNKKQVEEWKEMYAIHELVPDLEHTEPFTEEPSLLFLQQNQNLIVDTKHFTEEFKQKLISEIDELDEQTNGLLINSENFQALQLLQENYRNKVKCIYTDPPYNAKSSEILYKNTFKHASWLSLMENRLTLGNKMLEKEGIEIIAIDEVEQCKLMQLLIDLNPEKEVAPVAVVHNPTGQQGYNISFSSEYAIFVYPVYNKRNTLGLDERENPDEWDTRTFRDNSGNSNLRSDAKNCFYPIYVKDKKIVGFGDVCADDFHPKARNVIESNGIIAVYPIDNNGVEKKWVFERGTVETIFQELWIKEISTSEIDVLRTKKKFRFKSCWFDKKYSANSYGSRLLTAMNIPFGYPKSIYNVNDCIIAGMGERKDGYVLDFFAGSATTAHAVLRINKVDQRNIKFILVEMGNYFDIATKTRIKKAIFSDEWHDGKPNSRNGISQCFKYIRLEQYEDALNNISLKPAHDMRNLFGDDYILQYMLDIETRDSLLNVKAFTTPFEYEMRITEKNETKLRKVDVCETFNYLIGLTVVHQGAIQRYQTVEARNPEYEGAVDLVADREGQYQFRQIEGTLRNGDKVLVIWRNITDDLLASNAALDAYFLKYRLNPRYLDYDIIYVNGDSNLENLRRDEDLWKVERIEVEFNKRMFEEN